MQPLLVCRYAGILLLCCLALSARAQEDTTRRPFAPGEAIKQSLEDFILNTETDEQVDYSFITDPLQDLLEDPLDLNQAPRQALLLLPGMNELMVLKLRTHIRTYGPLLSVYELQAVEGFTPELIRGIAPYITVRAGRATDILPENTHPQGPGWQEVREGLRFEVTQRFGRYLEPQRGYTDPDTTFREVLDDEGNVVGQDTSLSSRYAGSPARHYTRIRARYRNNVSLGLTGEKDPGEAMVWNPARQQYGYDFLSFHAAIQDYGRLKSLVVGDYQMQFGQGLVLSRGLGFGKGVESVGNVKMPSTGIRPYASVNEAQFQRGIATTVAQGPWYLTGFFSRRAVDATAQEFDTLTNEVLAASALQTSGLHRTTSERANRLSVTETLYGGRLAFQRGTLSLGTTHYVQRLSSSLERAPSDYNRFDFSGNLNQVSGVDVDWIVRNFNVFGEVARSRSGGWGATAGLMGSIARQVDVALLARHFDPDFHSLKGYAFAERPVQPRNETGLYLGIKILPSPRWQLSGYLDQFYFRWNRFLTAYPSAGWETMAQLSYKPKRGTEIYLRFRTDHREQNAESRPAGQQLHYLVPVRRDQLRLHAETQLQRDLLYRTRLEFSWYSKGESASYRGMLLYQDLVWRVGFRLRLSGRFAIFDVPDYNARIYAYENDILGFFSIPPYNGTGTRYYLMAQLQPLRNLDIWLRLAQTRLFDATSFGSGLDQIDADHRTELKMQVRWQF
ncbi:MAG: helix-hairpin-helix domain-containing protein [Bacteroidia bacterium]